VLYILLPIAVVAPSCSLAGRPPDVERSADRHDPRRRSDVALGPIASQEVIKEIGNNGGGFFNANSAHPFESPTPLTNWLEIFGRSRSPSR
jgi:K+-transporting ATPase ATPase A chain